MAWLDKLRKRVISSPTSSPPPSPSGKGIKGEGSIRREGDHLWLRLDAETEMEFVRIPAGEFLMGLVYSAHYFHSHECPQHKVHLDEYWMGRYPVTNRQYQAFVLAQEQAAPLRWHSGKIPPGKEDHPMVYVSWDDTEKFCDWLYKLVLYSAGTVREMPIRPRLPSEAEWEKAARGPDGRIYPWGNQAPDQARCNFKNIIRGTTPVGRYSPLGDSPFGCADMAGNVWEYVADWYYAAYYGISPASNPTGPTSGLYRVLRGGSWSSDSGLQASERFNNDPTYLSYDSVGFRCAASPGL